MKFDRLGKTTSGQPIFAVDEETAREIRATFIIDLALLRSYGREDGEGHEPLGLNRQQKEFLLAFALWKIQELLGTTFSYRSGCKLKLQKLSITTEEEKKGDEPLATELPVIDIRSAISAATFPVEPITSVYYPFGDLFKPSKEEALVGPPTKPSPKGKARSEMPLILEQSFPLGRFHATRWNQNPFEDPYGEWPPSSWRLLRALAARWFQYSRETVIRTNPCETAFSPNWHGKSPVSDCPRTLGGGPRFTSTTRSVWKSNTSTRRSPAVRSRFSITASSKSGPRSIRITTGVIPR